MIKIKYLCEYPQAIPALAQIWYDSIGQKWRPDIALTEVERRFNTHLNKDALPLSYLAFDGEIPIGMSSLRSDDGLLNSKLFPWLGSLCVKENYRKRGIGKLLVQIIKEKAHKMGFRKIYLFTFEQKVADWYADIGWKEIEKSTFQDKPVIIMEIGV